MVGIQPKTGRKPEFDAAVVVARPCIAFAMLSICLRAFAETAVDVALCASCDMPGMPGVWAKADTRTAINAAIATAVFRERRFILISNIVRRRR